jgi:iron complex outermembrane receptor protein
VISITTVKPKLNEFSGKVYASYGERNDRTINGTVNIPLGHTARCASAPSMSARTARGAM